MGDMRAIAALVVLCAAAHARQLVAEGDHQDELPASWLAEAAVDNSGEHAPQEGLLLARFWLDRERKRPGHRHGDSHYRRGASAYRDYYHAAWALEALRQGRLAKGMRALKRAKKHLVAVTKIPTRHERAGWVCWDTGASIKCAQRKGKSKGKKLVEKIRHLS